MPHHKSCKKRLKTSEKSRIRNRNYTSQMRSNLKIFRAIESPEEAGAALPALSSLLDRMAKKGVIKHNRASRLKSRLQQRVNGLAQ